MKEKRTNKHGLGLAPSAKREKFMTFLCSFLCICEISRACIRAKFPQSHQERWLILSSWPTWPLAPHVLAVTFHWPSASPDFCRLLFPADCPVLSTALVCSALFCCLSSSVFFQSRGRSRAQALCVGLEPKQTKRSSYWHTPTHPQKRMPPIVSQWERVEF